ncbi:hypothetical protein Bbelb_304360 [Branchiostoma belcheri]|nr:hypothetical protein Bbelb_304360 [Branchiostoma belcheri]
MAATDTLLSTGGTTVVRSGGRVQRAAGRDVSGDGKTHRPQPGPLQSSMQSFWFPTIKSMPVKMGKGREMEPGISHTPASVCRGPGAGGDRNRWYPGCTSAWRFSEFKMVAVSG